MCGVEPDHREGAKRDLAERNIFFLDLLPHKKFAEGEYYVPQAHIFMLARDY
jgi:hypothetical protein